MTEFIDVGDFLHALGRRLWPINRSLTGVGVRETLGILQEYLPELQIHGVGSGTQCFDWVVPDEWEITEAFLENEMGERILDFSVNNLHVVGYSMPVDIWLSREELEPHLYSLPEQPDAIPYITSYYSRRWGFCLAHKEREALLPGRYHAVIRSRLFAGVLNYAELVLPGESKDEVLLSTYVCHPSMANNELSGPLVTLALARWLKSLPVRRYTYRIVFVPETIGSILYLSLHADHLKKNCRVGYVVTCIGDDRTYSFLPSRRGNSLADRVARHVLRHMFPNYVEYSYLDRGSDERQYCSPGINLPVASVMRSKYGEFPEYHTSLDDLTLVTPTGLAGGYAVYRRILEAIECDCLPKVTVCCEPQLGKRGLYPNLSTKETGDLVRTMMNFLAFADGEMTLLQISDAINAPIWEVMVELEKMKAVGLVRVVDYHHANEHNV